MENLVFLPTRKITSFLTKITKFRLPAKTAKLRILRQNHVFRQYCKIEVFAKIENQICPLKLQNQFFLPKREN